MRAGARPPRRVYSAVGGFRSAFVRARRRLLSRRRCLRRLTRAGRNPAPRNGERLAELLDEPLDCELAIPRLAPLVLRDGAQHRPGSRDDTPLLRVRQRCGCLDVEQAPRPAWTTSGRADRRGHSSVRPAA